MNTRRPDGLFSRSADIVIVGGGIHGCTAHLLASLSGLRSVLVEREDFGSGASWNTSRILHGGIRYLQTGDLRRLRASVASRAWFFRTFPEFTSVMPCLMPLYGVGSRRRSAMKVAVLLQDLLSWDRNRDVPATHFVPGGRLISPRETFERFPLLCGERLQGGALWFDGLVRNPSRILMETLNGAASLGGQAHNYLGALEILVRGDRVAGVTVKDMTTGREFDIATSRVVLCTGSFDFDGTRLSSTVVEDPELGQLAFNLLLKKSLPSRCGVAIDEERGRGQLLFLVPLETVAIVGTHHQGLNRGESRAPSEDQANNLLRKVDASVPGWNLVPEDILGVLSGVVPRKTEADRIDDHTNSYLPRGCIRVRSAKYTTAPVTSAKVLRRLTGIAVPLAPRYGRPPAARVMSARGFLETYAADRKAARGWVEEIWDREQVKRVEDFVLRRMDWATEPEFLSSAQELLQKLVKSNTH